MEKEITGKTLWLDIETHRKLKILSAELGLKMPETIAHIFSEYERLKNNDKQ